MDNPWLSLPKNEPFVLADDHLMIQAFNTQASEHTFVQLELLPEPFLGNPHTAKVILLNLNPGFSPNDRASHHDDPYFVQTSRANLEQTQAEYPLYLLNPHNHVS